MTENNAAQAIRDAIRKAYDDGYNDAKMAPDNASTYCVESATRHGTGALLSKLRAEGVQAGDERAPFEAWMASKNLGLERDGDSYSLTYARRAWDAWQARAALASAHVDPETAKVDFLVRVFEDLDTWRAEEWNELIERRPAILALLRPLVMASAPVAGEAIIGYVEPIYLELRRRGMPVNGKVQHSPVGCSTAPLYAAPQASEAVRNAEPVAYCQPDDPINSSAFSWPGMGRKKAHTTPLYAGPQADKDGGDVARLRRIAWLIGSIFVHGDFKAETANERELEKLLRENGTFWESLEQFDRAALSPTQPTEQGERDE